MVRVAVYGVEHPIERKIEPSVSVVLLNMDELVPDETALCLRGQSVEPARHQYHGAESNGRSLTTRRPLPDNGNQAIAIEDVDAAWQCDW